MAKRGQETLNVWQYMKVYAKLSHICLAMRKNLPTCFLFLSSSQSENRIENKWSCEEMISWHVLHCKHSSRGFNFSREKVWKHFHATFQFQPQLQFTSLLHQFSGQCHEFPFQNSSLFFHYNPYPPSLSSLAPVTVVSRTKYLCNFKHMNNPPRSCPQYCLFLVTLYCVFSCF